MSGTHLERFEFQAKVNPREQQFSASGSIQQWELTQELQPWLQLLNESLGEQTVLHGVVNGTFEVQYVH